jgi:hypothetical protein
LKKHKWCNHCKEFHKVCFVIWEFRKNAKGEPTPYRCKIARRKRYPIKEKPHLDKLYAEMPKFKKKFINTRKKLRKRYNDDKITEKQFNHLLEKARKTYLGALDREKAARAKSDSTGVCPTRKSRRN